MLKRAVYEHPDERCSRRGALQHQVLKLGIQAEQAWVGWCDETLEVLDRLSRP